MYIDGVEVHMMIIEEPGGLKKYLKQEERSVQTSYSLYGQEFELFCQLAELYERLGMLTKIPKAEVPISASSFKLFLVVMSQMYGVASQLLRRRVVDAEALSRRAIEATATAYRLWKHPELSEVFNGAYPNAADDCDPKQWRPSREYREKFKTGELFSEPGEVWIYLRSVYDMFSAGSSHAGPVATASLLERDDAVEIQFIESDNRTVRLAWNYMLDAYWEMLRVFLQVTCDSADPAVVTVFEQELSGWKKKAACVLKQRDEEARRQSRWVFGLFESCKGAWSSLHLATNASRMAMMIGSGRIDKSARCLG